MNEHIDMKISGSSTMPSHGIALNAITPVPATDTFRSFVPPAHARSSVPISYLQAV